MQQKTAVIIGAGPAGLTAALEFLDTTDVIPVVFEASGDIGGISKTVRYKGNRIDIGGHRFFSKSDRVMDWWLRMLPVESTTGGSDLHLKYQGATRELTGGEGADPETSDDVMLVRNRLSRIYYGGKFYNYPITLEMQTMRNLGFARMVRMGLSYMWAKIRPRTENNLEDFYINRFGGELYRTFFRDYTEKVWGIECSKIAADWGAQRVKGLSVTSAISHAIKKQFRRRPSDLAQKDTETSLIEHFLYPKLGPGQMWEKAAGLVRERGGELHMERPVVGLRVDGGSVTSVEVLNPATGETDVVPADYVISTMPVSELIGALRGIEVPSEVREIAQALPYRDFITVGLLLRRLKISDASAPGAGGLVPDNWIYIQEPDVKVGRLQVFNNWSPYLVADPGTVWIGMEYFVNEGDELWTSDDEDMARFGISELARIGIIDEADVLDSTVIRVKKTYPAYFGSYARFDEVREFVDGIDNLFLVGRNGQHRYNNQDHSMLTAMEAVAGIAAGRPDKSRIWSVNVEQEYHESRS